MKLPENINKVTLLNENDFGAILPLGFVMFEEGNDFTGNYFGLYWGVGTEDKAPIVCWFDHEEGVLNPEFPNLDCFLRWLDCEDKDDFEFLDDEELFLPYFNRGKVLARKNKSEEAIKYLEYSIKLFDEYSDSWYYLSKEYQKTNQSDSYIASAIASIKSNWFFGFPTQKAIDNLKGLEDDASFQSEPIFKYRETLGLGNSFSTGVTVDFEKLKQCISEYHELKDYKSSAILNQNYAYMMMYEKDEIQQKHNFDLISWQKDFEEYCKTYLNIRNYRG